MSTLNEMCCIYLFLCQALKKGDVLSDCLPLIMAQFQNLVVLCVVITGFIKILSNIMKLYIKTIHKESCTEGMFKVLPLHNRFPHTTWVWLFMFRVDLLFGLWILSSHSKQRFTMRSFFLCYLHRVTLRKRRSIQLYGELWISTLTPVADRVTLFSLCIQFPWLVFCLTAFD